MVEALQSQGKTQGERDHQLGKAAEKASHATRCPAALGKRCRKNNKNWLKGSQQNCHSLWKKRQKDGNQQPNKPLEKWQKKTDQALEKKAEASEKQGEKKDENKTSGKDGKKNRKNT